MYGPKPEDVFYYLTLYNEAYPMPVMPAGVEDGIIAGLYRYSSGPDDSTHHARILASGPAMLTALDAQRLLSERYDVSAEVWSATSYKALRDDALSVERWNRLHPIEAPRQPYVSRVLTPEGGPVVAVTDFITLVPDQIARWVPQPYVVLGTDGFGLSDTRAALRRHFEVDTGHVVLAVIAALARTGELEASVADAAVYELGLDPEAIAPVLA
jgi:pyruvate dehydrogenase E1 component